jgi:hypothetical protein
MIERALPVGGERESTERLGVGTGERERASVCVCVRERSLFTIK